jgi:phospholipase A-2-activating protein
VNAVAYIPPTNDAPKGESPILLRAMQFLNADMPGYIVAGGQDALVNIWSLENPKDDPDLALVGHQQNVCAIHVGTDRTIISGSWDK